MRNTLMMCTMLVFCCLAMGCSHMNTAWSSSNVQEIRVLLLTGQNNHDWRRTTAKLQSILEEAGFIVEVTQTPQTLTAEQLKNHHVILSNWNTFGPGEKVRTWPNTTRKAYEDFVRNGGGHVVVHAGSCSFYDWREYHEIGLATWIVDQTHHAPVGEFPVRIDSSNHPVTRGLAPFRTTDELWNRARVQERTVVLASGFASKEARGTDNWKPIAFAGTFGRGHCFTLLFGHNADAMDNPGYRAMLLRGLEWAATGMVRRAAHLSTVRDESVSAMP